MLETRPLRDKNTNPQKSEKSQLKGKEVQKSRIKEAVCFSEELFKGLLGFSHKGNHINVLQKALLSPDVIATEITIIVPIKVILNEQYVILMFQYLGEESV